MKKGVVKLLEEAPSNNRYTRWRAEGTQKYAAVLLQSDDEKLSFAITAGEFGKHWAVNYKGKGFVLPSMNEVLEGLMEWYARQMESILRETKDKNLRIRAIKNSRTTFTDIFKQMDFTESEMNTPLEHFDHKILGLLGFFVCVLRGGWSGQEVVGTPSYVEY